MPLGINSSIIIANNNKSIASWHPVSTTKCDNQFAVCSTQQLRGDGGGNLTWSMATEIATQRDNWK